MDIKITRRELFKTAKDWMDAHMDTDHMCKCDDCKAILKFLSKKEYKDITDAKTMELIVDNFGEYITELTKDRLIAKELAKAREKLIEGIKREERIEMAFWIVEGIITLLLLALIVVCILQDDYIQATFNLGLILLIRTARK